MSQTDLPESQQARVDALRAQAQAASQRARAALMQRSAKVVDLESRDHEWRAKSTTDRLLRYPVRLLNSVTSRIPFLSGVFALLNYVLDAKFRHRYNQRDSLIEYMEGLLDERYPEDVIALADAEKQKITLKMAVASVLDSNLIGVFFVPVAVAGLLPLEGFLDDFVAAIAEIVGESVYDTGIVDPGPKFSDNIISRAFSVVPFVNPWMICGLRRRAALTRIRREAQQRLKNEQQNRTSGVSPGS